MKHQFTIISLFILLLVSCNNSQKKDKIYDFFQIKQKGELTILTMNSSTSYFIYKDEEMGYDYDLCKDFCDFHGLKLNVKVVENQAKLYEMLLKGEGDLIAYGMAIQNELKDSVIYCGLDQISHQVLVQQANRGDTLVKDVTGLIGKEVYVKHDTKYYSRLLNLDAELGTGIIIKDVGMDTVTTEDLIKMVALDEIKYTISDDNLAKLNKTYYRNIDISLSVSGDQKSMWVVRKSMPKLAEKLDEWFANKSNKPTYTAITKKYFELGKAGPEEDIDSYIASLIPKGDLSPYDELFKKHAERNGFDWRLLVAIAFHESRFRNDVSSWAGAVGIMGLMPRTAVAMGITSDDRRNPDLNIKAATKLLITLRKMFSKVPDPDEQIKLILASYNGGHGHIFDAQALARKYGADPYVWEGNVKKYVLLKSNPEYYNDTVCKNGYFRGTETVKYVDNVLSKWNSYKE